MFLLPKAEHLRLDCLTNTGVVTRYVDLKNWIPVTYDDYRGAYRRVLREIPTFVDDEMVYFNTLNNEFFLFDKEGQWDQKNADHPSLSLGARFNEKQWLDQLTIYQSHKTSRNQA
eukprot:TRINITY_DN1335_c0_g1_i1.p1 TRINITY_DN1335_c0_g1~~TRINITY_DN1335_c0_g1_i1.p1  ORF type:complete len:115 (+),score=28.28 TRINITY_DN1335_c0_g1_i1:329-673(+)